jgi:hypothetical protein
MNFRFSLRIVADEDVLAARTRKAVEALCRSQKWATGLSRKRIPLTTAKTDALCRGAIHAVCHAAAGPVPNVIRTPGAPPDNARIILAADLIKACRDVGISDGLRYTPPTSFVVELYDAVAPIVWPQIRGRATSLPSRRATFERMRSANITRN